MFGQKSQWKGSSFVKEAAKGSLSIGGRVLGFRERKKMLEKILPRQKFGSYISSMDVARARRVLSEQKHKGSYAQRVEAAKKLAYLEKATGVKKIYGR